MSAGCPATGFPLPCGTLRTDRDRGSLYSGTHSGHLRAIRRHQVMLLQMPFVCRQSQQRIGRARPYLSEQFAWCTELPRRCRACHHQAGHPLFPEALQAHTTLMINKFAAKSGEGVPAVTQSEAQGA